MDRLGEPPKFVGESHTLKDEIIIRCIKIVDIGYITTLYVIFAGIISYVVDKIFGEYDEKKYENKFLIRLCLEVIAQFIVIAILLYIGRNIIEQIPFPLHGAHGYDHWKVKEIDSMAYLIFGPLVIMFQSNLKSKIMHIYKRYMKVR